MATKLTKSVGNGKIIAGQSQSYWTNAAKQFIWPIDFNDLQILVPQKDLSLAEDNLMVQHFRAHGWHIQSVISVDYTKPLVVTPLNGCLFNPKKETIQALEYKPGDKFSIPSTGCELEITFMTKDEIQLKYINRDRKRPIVTNEKQLKKSLNFGVWKRI